MSAAFPKPQHLRPSDLRGLVDIAFHATRDVTSVVEGVHDSVHATLGLAGGTPPGRTGGITGLVYRSVNGITNLTSVGINSCLALAEPAIERLSPPGKSSRERDVLIGVLNGVLGDRLAERRNPLAIPMTLICQGREIKGGVARSLPAISGKLLVMVHGLCMTEHGWSRGEEVRPREIGTELAARLGYTIIYLRYNSGLAVAANGLELARKLEELFSYWPVPVEKLTLIGHSMGGLVVRSATTEGQQLGHSWPGALDHAVFLGTPLQGAPLERAGAWIDSLLSAAPYSRPFTTLTLQRSRGIRDLHDGDSTPAHRDGVRPEQPAHETGTTWPFPEEVNILMIAGTRSPYCANCPASEDVWRLAGDGLVPVASALCRHADAERDLNLPISSRLILQDHHHMALLNSQEVLRSVHDWLSVR